MCAIIITSHIGGGALKPYPRRTSGLAIGMCVQFSVCQEKKALVCKVKGNAKAESCRGARAVEQ